VGALSARTALGAPLAVSLVGPAGRRLRVEVGEPAHELPPPESGEATVALDTADPRYRPYLSGVKQRIWDRWDAPALPEGQEARGALVVEFTLTRSGRLAASGVYETSGVPALDRAALDAVARAVPFTPLPDSIAGTAMRVRARFVYDSCGERGGLGTQTHDRMDAPVASRTQTVCFA